MIAIVTGADPHLRVFVLVPLLLLIGLTVALWWSNRKCKQLEQPQSQLYDWKKGGE